VPFLSRWILAAAALAILMSIGLPAQALPIFAHRYGMSCQQCHTTVPTLNEFGKYFLAHGFRLPGGRGTVPLTVKTQITYSSEAETDPQPVPKFIVDEIELLSAGSIGRNTSYYLEQYAVDGGLPGLSRDMWVNFDQYSQKDDFIGPALHAKGGQFTLPLPVDPETQRPTLAHYLLFDQSVGGNAFTLFNPGIGTDFAYSDERHGFSAHFDTLESYTRQSGIPYSGMSLMATISETFPNGLSLYTYRYQGQQHFTPTADNFYRQAYGVGYENGKFGAVGLIQTGNDTSAYGVPGTAAVSSGGFLQASWTFDSALAAYARYDSVYDPFNGRVNQGTLDLVMRPANRYRFTLEATKSQGSYQFASGLLFAY
jgi:hypothetical protein